MQLSLKLFNKYTRKDVHDIFDPDSTYTRGAGTWGILGIIKIPSRSGDYVFFVTYGSKQGEHDFNEEITPEGVLTWQSQPRQKLSSSQIQDFIKHDDSVNTIHLFLRTNDADPFTYLGRLAYLSHDADREHPVYFKWQLLDWSLSEGQYLLSDSRITIEQEEHAEKQSKDLLEEAPPPAITPRRMGTATSRFKEKKKQENHYDDARDAKLGLAGEALVLAYEKKRLIDHDRGDLAEKVNHVSVVEGDSAGYDIRSWDIDGQEKRIEVKTTRGAAKTAFHVSINQVETSKQCPEKYVIYRVFGYNDKNNTGKFFERKGSLEEMFELSPTHFRALIKDPGLPTSV